MFSIDDFLSGIFEGFADKTGPILTPQLINQENTSMNATIRTNFSIVNVRNAPITYKNLTAYPTQPLYIVVTTPLSGANIATPPLEPLLIKDGTRLFPVTFPSRPNSILIKGAWVVSSYWNKETCFHMCKRQLVPNIKTNVCTPMCTIHGSYYDEPNATFPKCNCM